MNQVTDSEFLRLAREIRNREHGTERALDAWTACVMVNGGNWSAAEYWLMRASIVPPETTR